MSEVKVSWDELEKTIQKATECVKLWPKGKTTGLTNNGKPFKEPDHPEFVDIRKLTDAQIKAIEGNMRSNIAKPYVDAIMSLIYAERFKRPDDSGSLVK